MVNLLIEVSSSATTLAGRTPWLHSVTLILMPVYISDLPWWMLTKEEPDKLSRMLRLMSMVLRWLSVRPSVRKLFSSPVLVNDF